MGMWVMVVVLGGCQGVDVFGYNFISSGDLEYKDVLKVKIM